MKGCAKKKIKERCGTNEAAVAYLATAWEQWVSITRLSKGSISGRMRAGPLATAMARRARIRSPCQVGKRIRQKRCAKAMICAVLGRSELRLKNKNGEASAGTKSGTRRRTAMTLFSPVSPPPPRQPPRPPAGPPLRRPASRPRTGRGTRTGGIEAGSRRRSWTAPRRGGGKRWTRGPGAQPPRRAGTPAAKRGPVSRGIKPPRSEAHGATTTALKKKSFPRVIAGGVPTGSRPAGSRR